MYYFTIGSLEHDGFQSKYFEKAKYLGRAKTKKKYLAILSMLNVNLINNKTLNNEVDLGFFEEHKDNIIGDLYFVEDNNIIENVDYLQQVEEKIMIKEKITIINISKNEEIEAMAYFRNLDSLEEKIKYSIDVINEYSKEEKIKTLETIIMMQKIKGTDSMVDWLGKLKKLQENGENFII